MDHETQTEELPKKPNKLKDFFTNKSQRLLIALILLLCNIIILYGGEVTRYIVEYREDDLRYVSRIVRNSRNEAAATLFTGQISNKDKLLYNSHDFLNVEWRSVPFSATKEKSKHFSNLLYEVNNILEIMITRDTLESKDLELLKEYNGIMTAFEYELEIQNEFSRSSGFKHLYPVDRYQVALNNTELEFTSGQYPLLLEMFRDDSEPYDLQNPLKEIKYPKELSPDTLEQLDTAQTFRRDLSIAFAKSLFKNQDFTFTELDFDLKDSDVEVGQIEFKNDNYFVTYRVGIFLDKDRIYTSLKSYSNLAPGDRDNLKTTYKEIIHHIPIYDNDHIRSYESNDSNRQNILPVDGNWLRTDKEIEIGIDDYSIINYVDISGRSMDLAKMLNINIPNSYQESVPTFNTDSLYKIPSSKTWISKDSSSLITNQYAIINNDGIPLYRYEYKIDDMPFILVKNALTGDTVINSQIDKYNKALEPLKLLTQ